MRALAAGPHILTMAAFLPASIPRNPFAQSAPVAMHTAPAGTFAPGTKVQVGSLRVIIEKYLSEGGFAHVYVVRLPKPIDGEERAVLKRVAVPDKEHLANMRTEVDTMKRLRGQKPIVRYMDSHASQLKGGGYEVFLLMEFCQGGGLIDFMNTRLQNRLKEPEILKIFSDVAEGVACMHYLKPPLLHRDLKVENVLISTSEGRRTFKVCDFGSAAPPRPAATTAAEGRLIEDDIQRHTTLQYRSPEMIDVYRKQPIDEKSDIWALGVLLYKICYYTTPFEELGQMAILNARFKYPAHPVFSDGLKLMIASMLREQPTSRPNIYQVLSKACSMQGKPCPIKDIYTGRSQSEARKNAQLPKPPSDPSSRAGATLAPPQLEKAPVIPDIAPMRRGRPEKPVSHHNSAKPSPSPLRMIDSSDPFAALDGGKAVADDELSSKFPTLDQFSLLTDNNKHFNFDSSTNAREEAKENPALSQKVVNALADDAFARPPSPAVPKPSKPAPPSSSAAAAVLERGKPAKEEVVSRPESTAAVPVPQQSGMISTGTMTSPLSSFPEELPERPEKPVHRFPSTKHKDRPVSRSWDEESKRASASLGTSGSRLANLLSWDAKNSQEAHEKPHERLTGSPRSPASSRPSLEGSRPSMLDLEDNSLTRSRSAYLRPRPASANITSKLSRHSSRTQETTPLSEGSDTAAIESDTNIASDVDFLRAREEEERERRHHHHPHHNRLSSSGSRHGKRKSLPSISLSGTKSLLSGRFGDAFKKFEGGHNAGPISPTYSEEPLNNNLTPIAGSVATDLSDERRDLDEVEDVSPEIRREIEKRQLEAEERRVANAAAQYRQRVAQRGGEGGREGPKASVIHGRVQTFLNQENNQPAMKTATGYGKFTDSPVASQSRQFEPAQLTRNPYQAAMQKAPDQDVAKTASAPPSAVTLPASVASPTNTAARVQQRPAAAPKPQNLRTGLGNSAVSQNTESGQSRSPDDWEETFTKRYPSLSGLEMVETEIETRKSPMTVRTREV